MNFHQKMIDMQKEDLKNKVVSIIEKNINLLREKAELTHSMVDIDELDVIDEEDFSHQFESNEIEQLVKNQLNKEEDSLRLLKSLDFGAKSTCTPGAVINTADFNFIVGVPTVPFEYEGSQYVGISVNSPIYEVLKNAEIGEEFNFRGNNYTIESIY